MNSEEFYVLDQYYQFLEKGQDINLENWLKFNKSLTAKALIKKQKEISAYFNGEINRAIYRPTVSKLGLVIGNPISFLASYYRGEEAFFDII